LRDLGEQMGDEYPVGIAICQVRWGWVGIAWSEQGLVRVTLPQPTEAEARQQLPRPGGASRPGPSGLDLNALIEKLRRYFVGEAVVFDEPLDPREGTDFQRRIWALTREIPRGDTRSYSELAREAGSPGAARAVGQAMARNPWPVVVPCHRVVGWDGRLTGFGGGIAMKERMLLMEGALNK
jgi:methylated-DNA-[protein]-cysteine S-methyltransferase